MIDFGSLAKRVISRPAGIAQLPGPARRFPVGNALDFALRPPWQVTTEFASRYGEMSLAWLGPMPLVMVHDPEAIERVLVEGDQNGDVFKAAPIGALSAISRPNTSAFVENGAEHARMRRTGFPAHAMFGPWLDEVNASVFALARERTRSDLGMGTSFDKRMFRVVFDAVSLAVAGETLGDAAYADATRVFKTIDLRMRTNLPIAGPAFYMARKRWWDVFRRRVEAERAEPGKKRGLVSYMLPATRLSTEHFAIAMANVYPGGFFSTGAVILNALGELGRNPGILAIVRRALCEDVANQGVPKRAQLAAIEPLEQVLRETMRRHTPVPIFMRRVGSRPLRLGDHVLAPGTDIAIGPGPIHMNADLWPEPERFIPSRWTPALMAERPYGSRYFFPFGRGVRECEGRDIALTLARAVLAGCLLSGDFRLTGKSASEPLVQKFFFAVMMPHKISGGFA